MSCGGPGIIGNLAVENRLLGYTVLYYKWLLMLDSHEVDYLKRIMPTNNFPDEGHFSKLSDHIHEHSK